MTNNQFKHKLAKLYGKTDDQIQIEIASYIRKKGFIVKREHYMLFGKHYGEYKGLFESLSHELVNNNKVLHPDLVVFGEIGLIGVIEWDGEIHDKKTEKTEKRNQIYASAGITYMTLNKSVLKELDMDWKIWVDQFLNL